ncbi:hypothetical protein N7645_15225 [Pseudomonas juntendi]|uniref:hypothetical protein n=1 Tax=Pseudomonas TaxID=286 RepID=UPI0012AE4F6D|nr:MULTISPECIES: hypothetical protein [Pseudomonas]MDG9918240.1 hypothetical protein [Pseudomonas juntendi]MDH0507688.1 hypothetical protein [Pseudomonas juntendi]MDH1044830.1 hypothetical protein [Pseudomonas juntendi]MRT62355.1 hypothetical protein [Pseudomonas sp. CAH-1]
MSNYPDGNPNTYLGLQAQAGASTARVTVTGPGIEFDLAGSDQSEIAAKLNQVLSGRLVFCKNSEVVDQVTEIFTSAGTHKDFTVEDVTSEWHPDMVTDFQRIVSLALAKGSGDAKAIQQAHEQMIPF